jgi:protein phosphatase
MTNSHNPHLKRYTVARMTLALEVSGRTDVGRVRPHNEDNFGFDERLGIYVVCDGMGGHAAGEIASRIAVDTIVGYFREQNPSTGDTGVLADAPLGARMLAEAVKRANDAILRYANENTGASGMGTTLVAARFADDKFSIAHVGDSRIYLFREGELLQLTEDHSLVMEQVRRGMLTLEEAKTSSAQNIITRALGTDETTMPDLGEFPAQAGDILLMTTDGVLRHVTDDEIRTILLQIPSLDAASQTLIDAANEAGGHDNSTCILLRVVAPAAKKLEADSEVEAGHSGPATVEVPLPALEQPANPRVSERLTPPMGTPIPERR